MLGKTTWYHVCLAAVITYFVDDVILFLKITIVLIKKKKKEESFFKSTSSDLMKCFMIDGCSNFNLKIFLFCQLW